MKRFLKPRFSIERGFLLKCRGFKGIKAALSCIKKTVPVKRLAHAFCFTLMIALLSGCGGGNDVPVCGEIVCPAIGRSGPYLSVVDQNGTSVTDAEITRTIVRTNEVLPPISFKDLKAIHPGDLPPQHPSGGYDVSIGIDYHRIMTDPTGDIMRVTGLSQGRTFTVQFVVIRDGDPCTCNPLKEISGPSQVVIQ
jgi:hypothetical protein